MVHLSPLLKTTQFAGNGFAPKVVDDIIATDAKLLHSENAHAPMVCNASGKATEAKLEHP